MKLKRKNKMLAPFLLTSRNTQKLFSIIALLLIAIGGYGQDLSIENVTEDEDVGNMVFTVTLDNAVFGGTIVTYSYIDDTATGGIDYNNIVGPALVFIGNAGETQTITVAITDDFVDEDDNEDFTVQLGTPTNGVGLSGGGDARGRIRDNDTAGVNISTTTGITTEAGGQATFTFTLTSEPTANVTIPINQYDVTETSGVASVVLNASNWNTGVDLVVTGVDDDIIDGDIDDPINTGNVTSPDSFYDSLGGSDVDQLVVTNQDDDVAGVVVTPVSGTTTEAGGTATFNFALTSQPTNNVTIPISGYDTSEITGAASVVISPANWDTGEDLIITGVDDFIADGDIVDNVVTGNVSSSDSDYNSLDGGDVPNLTVTNTDDDSVSVIVAPTTGLITTEAGGTATFTVTLGSEPTADVNIALSSSNTAEGTVQANVTLTPGNWVTGVDVDITGVDDVIVDGDIAYTINTGNVTSADLAYNALGAGDVANVSVTNNDDDSAGVIVAPTTGLTTTEAGGTATFNVTLGSEPTDDVTIALTSSNTAEGTVAPNVTLTTGNWNTGVDVDITGVDDAIVDGNIAYTINTGNVTSADLTYNALGAGDVANVSVTNNDDDSAGVIVTPTTGLTTTEAGGTATFTVTLGSEPIADVTIALTSSNTAEGTVPPSVTLTAGNWNTGVDVDITGVDDAIVDGDITYTINTGNVTSFDLAYNALGAGDVANVSVTNNDDDSFVVSITATDDTATEAGASDNAVLTVDLGSVNGTGSSIVVNFTRVGSTATHVADYAAIGLSVTIANGQQTGLVTINPVDDALVEGNETVILTLAAGTGYTVGAPSSATATIISDDTSTISINDPTPVNEGNTGISTLNFTVSIDESNPDSNITVDYTISGGNEDGTGSTLTFLSGTTILSQTVSVTTNGDTAVEPDEVITVTLDNPSMNATISLTDDVGSSSFTDDDSAGLVIDDITVNEEDGTGTFTITLNGSTFIGTTVTYQTADDTAISGEDYTATSSTVVFGSGTDQTRTVSIPIIDDSSLESTEDFFLDLTNSSSPFITIVDNRGIATIEDDDNCAAAPILDSSIQTLFCDDFTFDDGTPMSLNDYTNSTPPTGMVLTWSTLSDPLNTNAHLTPAQVANPPNDGSYYGFFYDPINLCASSTISVELTLNPVPIIAETLGDERCGPGEVTLTANGLPDVDQPPTFNWYDSPTGGNLVGNGSNVSFNIMATTSYYVEATSNGCISERVEVTATVHPLPSAGIPTNAFACNVAANGPTIVDLDDLITGESTGEWSVTTDPSGTISIGIGNIVSFENRADGDYVFTYTTTDATPPFCENVSSDVTISVNDCDIDTDLDGLLDGLEIGLGTDPNNVDSDGDGIEDGVEVGDDTGNPLDEDEDGIIDALDSNVLDTDMDGVVDQLDPANTDPCVPDPNNEFCVATVDLEIIKTTDDDFLNVNEQLTFTITVTNISDITATLIQVNEVLDEIGFGYISHFTGPGDGVYDEDTGLWDIPMLEPNASATLVILVEALNFGLYVNTATLLSSSPADVDLENNESSVEIEVNERSNNICGFLFNQFSPNGDGTNDFLVINCITNPEYADNTLEIYDRYGNQVFSARGYDNTWDGTRDNNDLPKGTYFYILDLGDESEITKGWIQIIRE